MSATAPLAFEGVLWRVGLDVVPIGWDYIVGYVPEAFTSKFPKVLLGHAVALTLCLHLGAAAADEAAD